MAGADRVEGTLFGNGERTGNLDIVTVALNRMADGIETGLDFSDLPRVRRVYERTTRMNVPARQPYSGELVFTAFSGSHQDAIKKGMDRRDPNDTDARWEVPYLHIDPQDIGRTYDAIVRINSQSGKGGVAYVMSRDFGFELPKPMHPEIGNLINRIADEQGRELTTHEIYEAFNREYLQPKSPMEIRKTSFAYTENGGGNSNRLSCTAVVHNMGEVVEISGSGNGPISAFVHALDDHGWKDFELTDFHEHAIGTGADTEAVAYVQIEIAGGKKFWGAGVHSNIETAGINALVSAYNRGHR